MHRSSLRISLKKTVRRIGKGKTGCLIPLLASGNNSRLNFLIEDISWTEINLTLYSLRNSVLIYHFDIQLKHMQTGTLGLSLQHGAVVKRSVTSIYCFGIPPSHWHHGLSVTEVVGWLPDWVTAWYLFILNSQLLGICTTETTKLLAQSSVDVSVTLIQLRECF